MSVSLSRISFRMLPADVTRNTEMEAIDTERIAEHSASIASKELGRYLSLMPFEDVSLLFKDLTGISQYIHIEMPRINAVISRLRDAGWIAGRTEFSNTGIKSNCSIEDVISVLR